MKICAVTVCSIHNTLRSISQSKGNKAMKFGQVMKDNKVNIFFFKNHAENEPGKLIPDLFLFLKKALNEVKTSGLQLNFNIFR